MGSSKAQVWDDGGWGGGGAEHVYLCVYTLIFIYVNMYSFVYTRVSYIHVKGITVHDVTGQMDAQGGETHRIPYLYKSFSAKVTYIQWLFCGK